MKKSPWRTDHLSPNQDAANPRFQTLITALANSCHGSVELGAIKTFLSNELKKTAGRESFLLPQILQETILWDAVKDAIWSDDETRETNSFPFLQGDIVGTASVLALGIAEISQEHDLWLVLSPDCDCVRSPFVRVAPLFPVFRGTREDFSRTQRFGHALKLTTHKAFALPLLFGDNPEELRGYFADLEVPYYIDQNAKTLATPYASMTVTGWHLLNGLIQDKETRSINIREATAIRTIKR